MRGKVALVTGATSGIGLSVARLLALEGVTVWAVGRRTRRLASLQREIEGVSGRLCVRNVDLKKFDELSGLIEEISVSEERLDIVVANAGVMSTGKLENFSNEDIVDIQSINGTASMILSRASSELLAKTASTSSRQVADLVFIGSTAARIGFSGGSVYNFTKFGVSGFAEALRHELRCSGVRVSTVHPGTTASEIHEVDRVDDEIPMPVGGNTRDMLAPDTIAEIILHVVKQSRHVNIPDVTVVPTGDGF